MGESRRARGRGWAACLTAVSAMGCGLTERAIYERDGGGAGLGRVDASIAMDVEKVDALDATVAPDGDEAAVKVEDSPVVTDTLDDSGAELDRALDTDVPLPWTDQPARMDTVNDATSDVDDVSRPSDESPQMGDVTEDAPRVIVDAESPRDGLDVEDSTEAVDVPRFDANDVLLRLDAIDVQASTDVIDVVEPSDVFDVPMSVYMYTLVPGEIQTSARQGNDNGTDHVLHCNAGEVLVGLSIRASSYVSGFASRCAALRTNGTLGPIRETSYHGGAHLGSRYTDDCPAGSLVVGLMGRAGGIVDRVAVQCASLASWIPGRTLTATLLARGGQGGIDFAVQCAAGFVGLGVEFDTVFYSADFRASRLRLACVRVNRQPP